ncbi:MAG: DUF5104 domain-containing protein, partial [Pseudolysinimonas sp.]
MSEKRGPMRKLLLVVASLVTVAVLSSCSLLPLGAPGQIFDGDSQVADAEMEKIADAVNSRDAAALKALFTPSSLEQAPDIDQGVDYFLSLFPNGGLSWERDAIGAEGGTTAGKQAYMIRANYKLSVDGKDYWLFFADFTVNHDPENIGLYAAGITPWTEGDYSGAAEPFVAWISAIHYGETNAPGYAGIYVPE